jgi:putative YphP/YqiW family bacilliredoxin
MYPEEMVAPMRAEVTELGVEELRSSNDVNDAMARTEGSSLYFINSVCGCAAGSARPGLAASLAGDQRPAHMYTAFAGNDVEAVESIRSRLVGYPPSSPFFALFRDGDLVAAVERHEIQGMDAEQLAQHLRGLYAEHCSA